MTSPTGPRDTVIAAGRQCLLLHGVDALRSVLNASALSEDLPLSRDTAYRVFRDDQDGGSVADAIVTAVAEAANDPAWGGSEAALAEVMDAYQSSVNEGNDAATHLVEGLRALFQAQFHSPGQPVGWMLQAAALTASSEWRGDPPPADAARLGRSLLDSRRDFYRTVTDQMVALVAMTMSEDERRIRAGIDPRTVVVLVHCMLDGAVLRRFIEPDAMGPDLFAEAVRLLWRALTEEGSSDDPRRPGDEHGQRVFDRVLAAASELWLTRPEITVEEAAARASVPSEVACQLFPDLGDLADSLVRSRVVGGGLPDLGPCPDAARARHHLPALVSELGRLRDLADALPNALAAARARPPTTSKALADDLVDCESRTVHALDITPHPERLVHDLLTLAAQGNAMWPSVIALMRTIGYQPDR